MKKLNPPEWFSEGPMDLEYKSYRMLSKVKSIRRLLRKGDLEGALSEIDPVLDYLYIYDATQAVDENLRVLPPEFDPNLELVYSSKTFDVERSEVMDKLCDKALNLFEDLHSEARDLWRDIESTLVVSYFYKRPNIINDGFIFIQEDKKLQVYSFVKPNKYIFDWREFNPKLIQTRRITKDDLPKFVGEIVETDDSKIIINVNYGSFIKMSEGVMCVIKASVFNMLKRDYGF
jgi:hypothetical protein